MPPHVIFEDPHDTLTQLLAVRKGFGSVELIIGWAGSALEHGVDAPSLSILAGLGPSANAFEAQDFFARVLAELEIEAGTPEQRSRAYVQLLCERIVDGSVDPHAALAELLDEWERHRGPDLTFAYQLSEDIALMEHDDVRSFYPGLRPETVVETLRREARAWLRSDRA